MTENSPGKPCLRFVVISLFPDSFSALTEHGISSRAEKSGLWQLYTINPRDYANNAHRRVDDRPYGGGPGMIMQAPPLRDAIQAAKELLESPEAPVLYLSPQGQRLDQTLVRQLMPASIVSCQDYILVCGRYEGVDERLIQKYVDREISIGDYVLSGGELPAMVLIDSLVRLLPGACGHEQSTSQDSFSQPMLDHEQYTRPEIFDDIAVPEVLLGGDHGAIAKWRQQNALARTRQRRPDLLDQAVKKD